MTQWLKWICANRRCLASALPAGGSLRQLTVSCDRLGSLCVAPRTGPLRLTCLGRAQASCIPGTPEILCDRATVRTHAWYRLPLLRSGLSCCTLVRPNYRQLWQPELKAAICIIASSNLPLRPTQPCCQQTQACPCLPAERARAQSGNAIHRLI